MFIKLLDGSRLARHQISSWEKLTGQDQGKIRLNLMDGKKRVVEDGDYLDWQIEDRQIVSAPPGYSLFLTDHFEDGRPLYKQDVIAFAISKNDPTEVPFPICAYDDHTVDNPKALVTPDGKVYCYERDLEFPNLDTFIEKTVGADVQS